MLNYWNYIGSLPGDTIHQTAVVFDNKMWVMGGTGGTDAWFSTDGKNWTAADPLPVSVYGPSSVVFDNKMWLIGGYGGAYSKKVFYTIDGVNWSEAGTDSLPLGLAYHTSVVFNNKIWIVGGSFVAGDSNATLYSSDGITWTFGGSLPNVRQYASCVVYNGQMWVVSGGPTNQRKVFSSPTGALWLEVGTDALPLGPYYADGPDAVVFRNRIHIPIAGGISGVGYVGIHSTDGINWDVATMDCTGHDLSHSFSTNYNSVLVYNDMVWKMGGQGGYAGIGRYVWASNVGNNGNFFLVF